MTPAGDAIRPTTRTQVPENVLRLQLEVHNIPATSRLAVVGTRGFYKSIAGARTGENLIGVYDDAISIVTPARVRTFLGNTDPSRTIDDRAILEAPQVLWWIPGVHGWSKPASERRPAFVEDSTVQFRRFKDGALGELQTGRIKCNNHDGSIGTTGSAACQTIAPEYWLEYSHGILEALGIPVTEWETVATRIRQGEDVPAHWKIRFPYILTA